MMINLYNPYNGYLEHHGILGMKWGKLNGPPYPLDAEDHSKAEKKAGYRKSLGGGRNEELYDRKSKKQSADSVKKNKKRSSTNDKLDEKELARRREINKRRMITALKVGAGLAATAAVTYGAYSLYKSGAFNDFLQSHPDAADDLLQNSDVKDVTLDDVLSNAQTKVHAMANADIGSKFYANGHPKYSKESVDKFLKEHSKPTASVAKEVSNATNAASAVKDTASTVKDAVSSSSDTASKYPITIAREAGYFDKTDPELLAKQLLPMSEYQKKDIASLEGQEKISRIVKIVQNGSGKTLSKELAERTYQSLDDYTGASFGVLRNAAKMDTAKEGAFNADPKVNLQIFNTLKIKNRLIQNFLDNSPKYKGEIFRGVSVSEDVAQKIFNSGSEGVDMLGHSSWSKDPTIAKSFADDNHSSTNPVKIVFHLLDNKSGVDITSVSAIPYEQEVLCPQTTRYIIDKVEKTAQWNGEPFYSVTVHER